MRPYKQMWWPLLGAFSKLRKAPIASSCLSVCPSAWKNSAPTGRIFVYKDFSKNLSRKFKFNYNLIRITDSLHEDLGTFMITSLWMLLRMISVSDKSVEKTETHILWSIFSENCAAYEIVWTNMARPERPQMTMQNDTENMQFAFRASKARIQTHT